MKYKQEVNSSLIINHHKTKNQTMSKIFLTISALFFLMINAISQGRTIMGTITDDKGSPLSNASVTIKGVKTGTATASDGSFRLISPANAKSIIVSSVGFQTQEIVIGSETNFAITLNGSNKSMEEIVMVGYGTVKKEILRVHPHR